MNDNVCIADINQIKAFMKLANKKKEDYFTHVGKKLAKKLDS